LIDNTSIHCDILVKGKCFGGLGGKELRVESYCCRVSAGTRSVKIRLNGFQDGKLLGGVPMLALRAIWWRGKCFCFVKNK